MKLIEALNTSWTLFLDRDGVINHEKHLDYIRHQDEFIFYDGVLEAIQQLSKHFGRIIVVTNQRGIGRGLMTHEDLAQIHHSMLEAIRSAGGQIDAIYYAPDLDKEAIDRKPNTGMGLKAKAAFPEIDFTKSIMVGNNVSDTKFGKSLDMITVYLETTKPLEQVDVSIDLVFDNLVSFSEFIEQSHPLK